MVADAVGAFLPGRVAAQAELADRCDGCQCFAPKTKAHHAFQFIQRLDFRGGVAHDSQFKLVFGYAFSVVLNADALNAPTVNADGDFRRTRIKCVLQKLFHNGGRPIHHFASGDLADQHIRQQGYWAMVHPPIIVAKHPI